MPNASYKFDENLLKRSRSDHIDTARSEWAYVTGEKQKVGLMICICGNKNVQNFHYFFNIVTGGEMIATGEQCAKKLGLRIGQGSGRMNPVFREFLIDYRAEYTTLNDLVYTGEIKRKFIEFIERRIRSAPNLNEAYTLVKGLVDMFHSHNCRFPGLETICNDLKTKIDEEEIERLEAERKEEAERLEQEEINRVKQEERTKAYNELRERNEIKRREREAEKAIEEQKRKEIRLQREIRLRKQAEEQEEERLRLAEESKRLEKEEYERTHKEECARLKKVEEMRKKTQIRMDIMREIREWKFN